MSPAVKQIVAATDFSEVGERAVAYATSLASQIGAEVTVVHAYETRSVRFPEAALAAMGDDEGRMMTAAENALAVTAEKYGRSGVVVVPVLRVGVAWDEINKVAADVKADLIIVGTHGRRGLSRAILGSVTDRLLRTATRPVLVVHGDEPAHR